MFKVRSRRETQELLIAIIGCGWFHIRSTLLKSKNVAPIGFTEDELEKSDYFEICGEIVEKGVVVYNAHG